MRGSETNAINQDWINLQDAGVTIDRNKLTAEILSELRLAVVKFENEGLSAFLSRWQKMDNYLNRPVKLIIGNQEILVLLAESISKAHYY